MCFELADPRGSRGQGEGAAASEGMSAMAVGSGDLMSDYYQAQEMSTMVSALTHVVAGGAATRGSGREERAMHGGYAHEMGRYPGAPSPEFAGNPAAAKLLPWFRCLPPNLISRGFLCRSLVGEVEPKFWSACLCSVVFCFCSRRGSRHTRPTFAGMLTRMIPATQY
jgi:hypothetical protein